MKNNHASDTVLGKREGERCDNVKGSCLWNQDVVIGRGKLFAGIYEDGINRVSNREQKYRLTNIMRDRYLHRMAGGCCRVESMQVGVGRGWTPAPGGRPKAIL